MAEQGRPVDLSAYANRQPTHRLRNFAVGSGAALTGLAAAGAAAVYAKSHWNEAPAPITSPVAGNGDQAGAAPRPSVSPDGGLVIPSLPTRPETQGQEGPVAVPAYHSDIPVCLINPDSRLQAEGINVFQEGQWFRPVYDSFQVNPDADQWRGVGSWGVAVAFESDQAYLKTKGNVGELTVRVNDNLPQATFAFGIMTNGNHIDEMKWGETPEGDRVQNSAWDMGAWIRTQPGAVLTMMNPDTGLPYMVNNQPVTIQANDHGDAGILLPREGRVAFVVTVTTAAGAHPFETDISFGPNDKDYMGGNIVDMRTIAAKQAIPDQRPQ